MNLQSSYRNKRAFVSDFARHRREMNNWLNEFAKYRGKHSLIRATNRQTLETIHLLWDVWTAPVYVHAVALGFGDAQTVRNQRELTAWCRKHFGRRAARGWTVVPMWWPRQTNSIIETVCYGIVISTDQEKMSLVPIFMQDQV